MTSISWNLMKSSILIGWSIVFFLAPYVLLIICHHVHWHSYEWLSLLINPVSADHQVHDNPISPWLLIIWLPDLLDIWRIHVFFPCFLRIGSVIHCLKNLSRDSRFRSLVTRSSAASSFASSLQTNSEKVIISYYSNPCVNENSEWRWNLPASEDNTGCRRRAHVYY